MELADLTKEAASLKKEIDAIEVQLKAKKTKLSEYQGQLLKVFEAADLDKISSHGFTFYIERRSSVKTPKTLEDKKRLFDYLDEKGIFMEFASVNSQSLNKLYKTLEKEALDTGEIDFRIPGVDEPTEFEQIKMRRG